MSRPEIVTPKKVLCVNSEKLVFKRCDLDFLLVAQQPAEAFNSLFDVLSGDVRVNMT